MVSSIFSFSHHVFGKLPFNRIVKTLDLMIKSSRGNGLTSVSVFIMRRSNLFRVIYLCFHGNHVIDSRNSYHTLVHWKAFIKMHFL